MLTDQLPTCRFCESPATRWRLPGLPRWGEDASFQFYKEEDAYAHWEEVGAPDEAYGTCDEHFEATRDSEGNITLTAAGHHRLREAVKTELKKGNMRGAASARKELKKERRLEVIARLGGQCSECDEDDPAILRIHYGHLRPVDVRSPTEWYLHLLEQPGALALASLRCPNHLRSTALSARDAAIEAYGGACVDCGATEGQLWVMVKPGTPALRWSNGHKMSSKEKYKRLAELGFPSGFEVRCATDALRNRG